MTHSDLKAEYYTDDEQRHDFHQKMGKSNRGHREDDRRARKKKHLSRKDQKQMDHIIPFKHGK